MAKVFDPPAELPAPRPNYKNYNRAREEAAADAWIKKLSDYCRKHGNGDLAGKEIRTGVADGYACYMVLSEKPFRLIHIPLWDAYSAGAIWERGLRLADARQMVERDEAMKSIFANKNSPTT